MRAIFKFANKKGRNIIPLLKGTRPICLPLTTLKIKNKKTYLLALAQYAKKLNQLTKLSPQILQLLNSHPIYHNLTLSYLEKNPHVVSELADFFGLPYLSMHLNMINLQLSQLKSTEIEMLLKRYEYKKQLPLLGNLIKIVRRQIKNTLVVLKVINKSKNEAAIKRLIDTYFSLNNLAKLINLWIGANSSEAASEKFMVKYLLIIQKQTLKIEAILHNILAKVLAQNRQKIKDINETLSPLMEQINSIFGHHDKSNKQNNWRKIADDLYAAYIVCHEFLQKMEAERDLILELTRKLTNQKVIDKIKNLYGISKQLSRETRMKANSVIGVIKKLPSHLLPTDYRKRFNQSQHLVKISWQEITNILLLEIITLTIIGSSVDLNKILIFDADGVVVLASIIILALWGFLKNKKSTNFIVDMEKEISQFQSAPAINGG